MKLAYFLISCIFLITLEVKGQPSQTPNEDPDTIPGKEVLEMLEAMKLPEKLKEMFMNMKNEFTFQGIDQSGSFYGQINLSQHAWDSIENKFIAETITDVAIMYSKYLNKKDLKWLTKFYKSSSGQKWVTSLPEIQKEMSANIRAWMHKTEFELGLMQADANHKKLANAPADCSQFSEGKFEIVLPDSNRETFSITDDTALFGDNEEPYKIEWFKPCSYRLTEISEDHSAETMTIEINIIELRDNSYRFMGRIGDGTSFEGEVFKLE